MRELVKQQLAETPEKSDRQIAAGLGVSHHTVADQREKLESVGQIARQETIITKDGCRPERALNQPGKFPSWKRLWVPMAKNGPAIHKEAKAGRTDIRENGKFAGISKNGSFAGIRENGKCLDIGMTYIRMDVGGR